MLKTDKEKAELLKEISGVDTKKCMKCGRCSASCPSYDAMDIRPHQFVSYVQNGDVEPLLHSKSIWKCLSCFACVERCPRGVEPGKLVEAVRLMQIRQQDKNHKGARDIPEFADESVPQQLLMAAMRKYRK